MSIALDIDGTISDAPSFFAFLSQALKTAGHRIVILTYRDPEKIEATKTQLNNWNIAYDEVVMAPSLHSQGKLCEDLKIDIFFDDQDECIVDVPESVTVFKIRNGGNFDFEGRRWVSTSKLTELIR